MGADATHSLGSISLYCCHTRPVNGYLIEHARGAAKGQSYTEATVVFPFPPVSAEFDYLRDELGLELKPWSTT
jgi:hypothetical protein